MHDLLLTAHSIWRYIVLALLVIVVLKYGLGWLQRGRWQDLDRRLGSITGIVVDIQLLLGVILWGVDARLGTIDANPVRTLEHPITMIVAIAVMHVGLSRMKRADKNHRFRLGALTFVITGLIVALGVAQVTGVV